MRALDLKDTRLFIEENKMEYTCTSHNIAKQAAVYRRQRLALTRKVSKPSLTPLPEDDCSWFALLKMYVVVKYLP
jgi:hypothetical protein